jgi:hypothetical protein
MTDSSGICPGFRQPGGSILVRFADLVLRVELKPKAGDELKLGFEVIDVLLFVAH